MSTSSTPVSDSLMPATPHDPVPGSPPVICPTCGAAIPPKAPVGLCPKCALAGVADLSGEPTITVGYARFEAPTLTEIAAAFPQLEILELIGHGGMGAVYRARQPHLERIVALKVLPKSLATTPEFTERFTREARMLARLAHPNIVGIFDFGESGGYYYLLMEYVDGVNLRQAMKAGKFSPSQALAVVPEICEALQFAHDEGVLHRDIKPENILLDTKGRIKIADFGIAKLLVDTARGITLTQGVAPGTPQYMAPEQFEQPATVDHRADIYSLGVVLYEMLTGELPIGRFAAPSSKAGVGAEVDEVVFRALEKERDRRQQSAAEVKTEIAGMVKPFADAPRPAVGGHAADAQARPMLALGLMITSVVMGVLLPMIMLIAVNSVRMQESLTASTSTKLSSRLNQAEANASRALSALSKTHADNHPAVQKLKAELESIKSQSDALRRPQTPSGPRNTDYTVTALPLICAFLAFLLICIIPPTVFAWKQLRRMRALSQTEGRVPVLISAWFWPLVVMVPTAVMVCAVMFGRAPAWIQDIGNVLSMVGALALAVWLIMRTWKWLSKPLNATERRTFLDAEANTTSGKSRKLTWFVLISGIFAVICLIAGAVIAGAMHAPNNYSRAAIIPVGLLGSVMVAAYLWMVNRTYLPVERTPVEPGHNPWPKRVFWLVLTIFCAPIAMVGLSLLVPLLAYKSPMHFEGDYAVSVIGTTGNGTVNGVQIRLNRKTSGLVRVRVIFEGPTGTLKDNGDSLELTPGSKSEWTMIDATQTTLGITFLLPDAELGHEASSQMNSIRGQAKFANLRQLPLFELSRGEDHYRARLEFEFEPKP